MLIQRYHTWRSKGQLTLQTDATSPEIPVTAVGLGMVYIPAGSTITTLTLFASPRPSASPDPLTSAAKTQPALIWYPLTNLLGDAIVMTVAAGNCYALPSDCFGAGAIQMRANVSGTVEVSFKA